MTSTSRRFTSLSLALILALTLAAGHQAGSAGQLQNATPAASPVAFAAGCAGIGPYFQEVAALVEGNPGYAIMREAAFDALALSDDEAATVVVAIDEILPYLDAITPPEPARAWHTAYRNQIAWYRDLAANRDPLAHQRLINRDRHVLSDLGTAWLAGQSACGYTAWNNAWNAAFSPDA